MARDERSGLRLWDRLLLFVAWLVTCGLVYLLGVYVGRGTREHPVGVEDRIVRLPVTSTPPPEGQRPKSESELTFYESLGAGEHTASPPPTRAPAPGGSPPVTAPPPRAADAPASPPRTASVPPPPAAPPRAATVPPPAAPPRVAAPTSPPTTVPPPHTAAVPPPSGGAWTVLAGPTRDRVEAEGLQRQLHAHGYDATLVRIARDGETWYRVQVGRFATATQANETMQRLRSEGVPHAFVASE
jgi:cell division protein FtsN